MWIKEDLKRKRKHRRTATKIFADLYSDPELNKQLSVGKQTVINYVGRRKKELCKQTYETAMFGLHSMCEAQIDFGGVPIRILFDNMSSAVVHIEEHGKRTLTETFMRFTMHHRFKADFCNPDSAREKGNVENKVGYIRRNFLLPPPKIEDLESFNRELLDRCMADLQREHYVKKEQILDLFRAEQETLISLPRERFRVFTNVDTATVSTL